MPRTTGSEYIEKLRKQVEEAEAKEAERQKARIVKLHEKRAKLVEREDKITAAILEVDEEIAALVTGQQVEIVYVDAESDVDAAESA